MRILHILEATHGGTRRHVLDLLPALQARGVRNTLIYSPLRNPHFVDDATYLQARGSAALAVPMARGWGGARDVEALRAIASHLRREHYDAIHCHSTKAGLLGRVAQTFAAPQTPLVYTPHCVAFDTALPVLQRRAARWIEKVLAARTAHFIAVSQHEARAIRRAGLGRENVSVIYNGVDVEAFEALPPPNFPVAHDDFLIGCFGRLTRQKNQKVLLRALAIALPQLPRARLLLVGDGEDEADLRCLAQHFRVENQIIWAGDWREARPLYARCDVIAQPSRWEGCPYSILEAMTARRAIVASPVGGVSELLNDARGAAGVFCGAHDASALAHNLIALAADNERRTQLGERARERVEKYFHLATMVEKTIAVYEKVMM